MATTIDPASVERKALFDNAAFAGARVLEVGSGDGRLTLQYAGVARSVVGLEFRGDDVAAAAAGRAPSLHDRLRFVRGTGVRLPFGAATFDIALFAWSL